MSECQINLFEGSQTGPYGFQRIQMDPSGLGPTDGTGQTVCSNSWFFLLRTDSIILFSSFSPFLLPSKVQRTTENSIKLPSKLTFSVSFLIAFTDVISTFFLLIFSISVWISLDSNLPVTVISPLSMSTSIFWTPESYICNHSKMLSGAYMYQK